MTSRASAAPYTTQFESTVERATDAEVVLEETYFYPEGGGQPADRGVLAGVEVVDVQTVDGEVVHRLAEAPDLEPGTAVSGAVDPDFRTYCMRAHTASHVLYGAGRRLLADVGYGGFGITDEKVRVDFETTTDVDDEVLLELERLVNRAVWDSREVSWEELPRADVLDRDEVAFNTKTEEGVTGMDTVRVVEVDGWDVAACGGTHVRNTREIGPVTVLERSNPGEGLTRVEFAVGPTAIDRRTADRGSALAAARALDTRVADLPEAVERLATERAELADELEALQEGLVERHVADLREDTVARDGREWLVGAVPGLDSNGLAEEAQDLAGDAADVVVLVGEDGEYLAAAAGDGVDAGEVVTRVTDEFGGGGGGSPAVAQAGGLDAGAEAVVDFLRE